MAIEPKLTPIESASVGESKAFTGAIPYEGTKWLREDGSEYLVSAFPLLAAYYGATGAGDGEHDNHPTLGSPTAGYFRVPDSVRRVGLGAATSGSLQNGDSDSVAVGSRTGVNHTHSDSLAVQNATTAVTVNNLGTTNVSSSGPSGANTGMAAGYTQAKWNSVTDPHNGAGDRITLVAASSTSHDHTTNIAHGHSTNNPPHGHGMTGSVSAADGANYFAYNRAVKT